MTFVNRLEAYKLLGRDTIEANVVPLTGAEAELAEIDENLIRNDLTTLERGEHFARRKVVYEKLHPETKEMSGRELANKRWNADEIISSASFANDTAAKTGVSPRTIQQEVQIATQLSPNVRDLIRDTEVADVKENRR